jgi:DNA-directed RNA polymerase specialized sigma24 family protein
VTGDPEVLASVARLATQASSRIVRDEQRAEDVAQFVLTWAWQKSREGARFDELQRLIPMVTRRTAQNLRRHLLAQMSAESMYQMEHDGGRSECQAPWKEAASDEFVHDLHRALLDLPWRQRQAFVLHELHGLGTEEVGRLLRISALTLTADDCGTQTNYANLAATNGFALVHSTNVAVTCGSSWDGSYDLAGSGADTLSIGVHFACSHPCP